MKGDPLVCPDHERNHFVGGCISCTYNEMRRYQMLYEIALDTMRDQRMARENLRRVDASVDRFVYAGDHGLHAGAWAEASS